MARTGVSESACICLVLCLCLSQSRAGSHDDIHKNKTGDMLQCQDLPFTVTSDDTYWRLRVCMPYTTKQHIVWALPPMPRDWHPIVWPVWGILQDVALAHISSCARCIMRCKNLDHRPGLAGGGRQILSFFCQK